MIGGCSYFEEEKTNELYLIPKDYEGSIFIVFGIPGEPPLKKEGEYTVIPVERKKLRVSLKDTVLEDYGVYLTSTRYKDVNKTITDKYYYVNNKGERKKIGEKCVHIGSNGSSNQNGEEIYFQSIQVTKSQCGDEFFLDGSEGYYTQLQEVENFWLDKLR